MVTIFSKRLLPFAFALCFVTTFSFAGGRQDRPAPAAPSSPPRATQPAVQPPAPTSPAIRPQIAPTPQPGRSVDITQARPSADDVVDLPVWDLALHHTDLNVAVQQIAERIGLGYLPVGLHAEPGRPTLVLYAINLGVQIDSLALHRFEDQQTVQADIAGLLSEGWLPMGISNPGGILTALLIKTTIPIDGWGMAFAQFNLTDMRQEIQRRESQGYSLWALDVADDVAWLFFIDEGPEAPPRRALLQSYRFQRDVYVPAVASMIAEGWYPWGFAVVGDELLIAFSQNVEE